MADQIRDEVIRVVREARAAARRLARASTGEKDRALQAMAHRLTALHAPLRRSAVLPHFPPSLI